MDQVLKLSNLTWHIRNEAASVGGQQQHEHFYRADMMRKTLWKEPQGKLTQLTCPY